MSYAEAEADFARLAQAKRILRFCGTGTEQLSPRPMLIAGIAVTRVALRLCRNDATLAAARGARVALVGAQRLRRPSLQSLATP